MLVLIEDFFCVVWVFNVIGIVGLVGVVWFSVVWVYVNVVGTFAILGVVGTFLVRIVVKVYLVVVVGFMIFFSC